MAPTSLPGQKTTSSPMGRDTKLTGYPMRMSELLSQLTGSAYIVRRSLHDVKNIRKAKKAITTALKVQMAGLGFSMVELLSSCPTNWGISPEDSLRWIEQNMLPYFPLGDYKVLDAAAAL
jgi:2-oxoglutarate ferredoxin oxidoreductase subunit beta